MPPLDRTTPSTLADRLTIGYAAFALLALGALSIRGIIDPAAAAQAFGLPIADASAAFYHAVYRDRNLVLAVVGLLFVLSRLWRSLAILSTVAVTLPLYDIAALLAAGVPVVAIHPVTLVALLVLSVLTWRLARRVPAHRHARS